jgi:hypothetical protein
MLSVALLTQLRVYWKAVRPVRWLFEGRVKGQPLSPSTRDRPRGPEVAEILGDHAHGLPLGRHLVRVVSALVACRTARLGGHREVCPECGFKRPAYNSCRNRHCPKCQILEQQRWAERQERRLLPTHYFHLVFTVPAELRPLFRRAPNVCLGLLFAAVAETPAELGATHLSAEIGFTLVLHTWTQRLFFHPHIHVIVPGGGLAWDAARWVRSSPKFFLPAKALRRVFKAKLLEKLRCALRDGRISGALAQARALIARAGHKTWVVNVKRPLAGPAHVVRYLSRYTHRIAITNSRITSYDGQTVVFRYQNRQTGQTAHERLSGQEFARRFLRHVLPDRFVRIRHYGLLAARRTRDLARCRELRGAPPLTTTSGIARDVVSGRLIPEG